MCGIIGYIGENEATPILYEGLKSMEYRGYDSAGLCLKAENSLSVLKKKGYVSSLYESSEFSKLKGFLGIAHTRWATHGEPNEMNAHPHFDCNNKFAIVHNGIIENFDSLRESLLNEGHIFKSMTDSEVIAHLIEKFYKDDLIDAVRKAINMVKGTFAILVISTVEDKIIAARRGSPLLIGLGEKERIVASDIAALIKHTNKIIYLGEDEIAQIDKFDIAITDLNGDVIEYNINFIEIDPESIQKGDYKHFMIKEINEQPESIRNAIMGKIRDGKITLPIEIDPLGIKRIIILGCGTSWHSALIGKFLIEKYSGIPVETDYSSEFRYRDPLVSRDDLVIVISQSGETADTLAALREAKLRGAKTLGIVNVVGSSIAREVDSVLYLHAGPEISVASTKAFTSQITNLLLFSLYLRQGLNLKQDIYLLQEIAKIPEYIELILEDVKDIINSSNLLANKVGAFYLARGISYPVALEGALKLKEISYIHAQGYPSGEMKHGPIALVDQDLVSIFIANKDHNYEKLLSNMQEVKARKGKIIAIVNDDFPTKLADHIIKIPSTTEEVSTILNSVVLQLLAYFVADAKGINVDRPKNLAKSVTVE